MFLSDLVTFSMAAIFSGLVFVAVGIWAFCRKTPMHFWAGSTISPEAITDVKKYNRANGFMWIFAALPMISAPIIAYFDFSLAITIFSIAVPLTVVLLIVAHIFIYKLFSVEKK